MPVLADFTVIVDDKPIWIGDHNMIFERKFSTGGRHSAGRESPTSDSILSFNVKHLTHTGKSAVVKVNNVEVGRIAPYSGHWATAEDWHTQTIVLDSTLLSPGELGNELQIEAVRLDPDHTSPTNVMDDFGIKSVVCFFHQAA